MKIIFGLNFLRSGSFRIVCQHIASDRKGSDISESLNFWKSIPQKRTRFSHLVAREYPTIRSSFLWTLWRLLRPEVVEVIEAAEVLRPGKSLMRTSESSRSFSVGDCWGQQILLLWKLVDEIEITNPQDSRTLFNQILAYIFLSVRVIQLLHFNMRYLVKYLKRSFYNHDFSIERRLRIAKVVIYLLFSIFRI